MQIETVGVVGAGVMGAGVAQDLAQAGIRVLLVDVSDETLSKAAQHIIQSTRMQSLFKPPANKLKGDEVLQNVTFSTDAGVFRDADFIIENVTESWAIKEVVYKELDRACRDEVIIAANTSAIPITRIASVTRRAPRILGMHFMNPVPAKRMVEVIRGYHTSDETIESARGLLARLGKECIVVNDSPGFVSNRVLMLTVNEAIFLVHEQVAPVEDVDRIFRECFGHKMGPLETADLIGLDTILLSLEVLYESFCDNKYRPCPLLRKMVDAGQYGRKSGRGFYTYE